MIYLDTSVALAHLLAENQTPPASLWGHPLVSSRLMQYEAWTRIHALGLTESHGEPLRELLARIAFIELVPPVLARALEPFPVPVRTLDALHLSSLDFLHRRGQTIALASYDRKLCDAATAIGIDLVEM